MRLNILKCSRCGKNHIQLPIAEFINPPPEYTHYAVCTETKQPLMIRHAPAITPNYATAHDPVRSAITPNYVTLENIANVPTFAARVDLYVKMLIHGLTTVDEVRAAENLPPLST